MTEVEWEEEGVEAPRKRGGIPRWVWIGCGCGCLTIVVAVALASILMVRQVKEARDPEIQWPKLQEVLPFDERPTDLSLEMGNFIPGMGRLMDQFVLANHAEDYTAIIYSFNSPGQLEQMFALDGGDAPFGIGAPVDGELVELEVQERSVRALRFRNLRGQGFAPNLGPGIRVDLTRPGRELVVELRRTSREPLSDEQIQAFFAHFDVWAE